jgi:hypothetical protein
LLSISLPGAVRAVEENLVSERYEGGHRLQTESEAAAEKLKRRLHGGQDIDDLRAAAEAAGSVNNITILNNSVTNGRTNMTASRIVKVWLYVFIIFALISALAVSMTGEIKTVFVVAAAAFVMGLLGSMMAAFSSPKQAERKIASA